MNFPKISNGFSFICKRIKQKIIEGISADLLKLIATLAMVIDHCAVVLAPDTCSVIWVLRLIGRISAPIICYLISEGYHHTSNLQKYMGRLLLMAIVSHVPFNLCFEKNIACFWQSTSVMMSLLCGLVLLAIWKDEGKSAIFKKLLVIGLCILLAFIGDFVVLWIIGFGIFRGNTRKQILIFCLATVLYLFEALVHDTVIPYISYLGVFFAIPFILLYNGKKSFSHIHLTKRCFYLFYPFHLLVIYIIKLLVQQILK